MRKWSVGAERQFRPSRPYNSVPYHDNMQGLQNKQLTGLAKQLRKNMTKEEKHLWYDFLKQLPLTVNRQKNIGSYIVDFYIATKKIVIELDGIQHGTPENIEKDAARDAYLQKMGITVLRYPNTVVNQKFDDVCRDILVHLDLLD